MLNGENITLRPVREADLDTLRELDLDLDSRGDYWPLSIMSETAYRREFQETGFWGEFFGRLLMIDGSDNIIGEIMYFKTVPYMDEFEVGYRLFGKGHAIRSAPDPFMLRTRTWKTVKNCPAYGLRVATLFRVPLKNG